MMQPPKGDGLEYLIDLEAKLEKLVDTLEQEIAGFESGDGEPDLERYTLLESRDQGLQAALVALVERIDGDLAGQAGA